MAFDKKWEKNIYSQGGQLNNYPYDLVVSIFAKNFFSIPLKGRKKVRMLDLGCGAGNHAKFFAENGFIVFGVDGSKSAVKHCQKKFKGLGLKGDFIQSDFMNLPYPDNYFDACLDRESLYANNLETIKLVLDKIYKILKSGGLFVSFMFNEFHPDKKLGKVIGKNTYDNFKFSSNFYKSGKAHFTTEQEIIKLFSKFKIKNIIRHSLYEVYDKNNNLGQFDEYIIITIKK